MPSWLKLRLSSQKESLIQSSVRKPKKCPFFRESSWLNSAEERWRKSACTVVWSGELYESRMCNSCRLCADSFVKRISSNLKNYVVSSPKATSIVRHGKPFPFLLWNLVLQSCPWRQGPLFTAVRTCLVIIYSLGGRAVDFHVCQGCVRWQR